MIDFDKQIVAALSNIGLPCYYENFITSEITLPCITYVENNNSSYLEGDALRYSHLNYTIKLCMDNKTQQSYLPLIDHTMIEMGFVRNSCTELVNGSVIEKIMDYEAIGYEDYALPEDEDLEEGE